MLESGLSGSVRGCPVMGIPTAILGHKPPPAPLLGRTQSNGNRWRSTMARLRRRGHLAAHMRSLKFVKCCHAIRYEHGDNFPKKSRPVPGQ
jgi:hypothetical protein